MLREEYRCALSFGLVLETRIDLSRPDGATQLMIQSIIANKLKRCRLDAC